MSEKPLNELRDRAFAMSQKNGFTTATVGEDAALIHSEVSELFEAHRDGSVPTHIWFSEHLYGGVVCMKPEGIPAELADIIIRALDFAGRHGIDVDDIVAKKMAFNATRPFKHGKIL